MRKTDDYLLQNGKTGASNFAFHESCVQGDGKMPVLLWDSAYSLRTIERAIPCITSSDTG